MSSFSSFRSALRARASAAASAAFAAFKSAIAFAFFDCRTREIRERIEFFGDADTRRPQAIQGRIEFFCGKPAYQALNGQCSSSALFRRPPKVGRGASNSVAVTGLTY
eukprot:474376-Prorocentrum_minimum.AAC.2